MSRRRFGRIRQLPSGRYQVRHPDGAGGLVTAPRTFATRAEAERHLAAIETDQSRGTWSDPRRGRIRLDEWAEQWWATTVNLRPSTRARDRGYVNRYILSELGQYPLGDITQLQVRAWVAGLAGRGSGDDTRRSLSPATVRKAYGLLAKMLSAAVDAELIAKSPCQRVPVPRVERHEMRFLTSAEIAELAGAIDERYRALVLVGAYCGLRIGELAGLKRSRVNLLRRRLEVVEILVEAEGQLYTGPPKTSAGRRAVGIPEPVAAELEEHLARFAGTELVFPGPGGGPLRGAAWRSRFWHPAVERAGLAPLRPHDLRHTAVALWIAQGANPKQIAARAGHSSVSFTLDRYGHLFDDADDALMAGLADAYVRPSSPALGAVVDLAQT